MVWETGRKSKMGRLSMAEMKMAIFLILMTSDMMLDSNNTVLSTVISSHFENTSITERKK